MNSSNDYFQPKSRYWEQLLGGIIIIALIWFLISKIIQDNKYYIINLNDISLTSAMFIGSALISLFYQIFLYVYFHNLRFVDSIDLYKGIVSFPLRILLRLYPVIASILIFTSIIIIENHTLHIIVTVIYILIFPILDCLVLNAMPNKSHEKSEKLFEIFKKFIAQRFKSEDGIFLVIILFIYFIIYTFSANTILYKRGISYPNDEVLLVFGTAILFLFHTLISLWSFFSQHKTIEKKVQDFWRSNS